MWQSEEGEDEMVGQTYDNYEILETIGSGTFGKVYKVKNIKSEQIFAMKHVFQNKKFKNRELDIMKQISSQFAVKLHQHFYKEEGDVLDHLNKENVSQFSYGIPSQYLIEGYQKQLCSKIVHEFLNDKKICEMFAHWVERSSCTFCLKQYQNICHRDIKPSNILTDEDNAKFCDFGSAKVLSVGHKNISYICSRYYRAPELLLGAVYYSTQVDIWSLGCVIAQLLMNRALFQGSNANGMFTKIIRCIGSPTLEDLKAMMIEDEEIAEMKMDGSGLKNRILRYNPNSPEELIDLISRMIVFNPDRRITAGQALNLPLFK